MELITGIYLVIGTIIGIIAGFSIINWISEEIKYKQYIKDYFKRNPNDDIFVDI